MLHYLESFLTDAHWINKNYIKLQIKQDIFAKLTVRPTLIRNHIKQKPLILVKPRDLKFLAVKQQRAIFNY